MNDPTKLDVMIGLLAGREVDPGLLDELADPASEASRFLEATRRRSKALLPGPVDRPRSVRGRVVRALLAVGLGLVLFGLSALALEWRLRRFEASRSLDARDDARAIASAIDRLAGRLESEKVSFADVLVEVDDRLNRLERRLEGVDRRIRPDPALAEARDQIAGLRRDLSAVEKGNARQLEETRAQAHEAARLIKLLLDRTPAVTTPR